jgi:hypothetical protein
MGSRWLNGGIVVTWLLSMSWLVTAKVLPPLKTGDPPNYRSAIQQHRDEGTVCWLVRWNSRPLGLAATKTTHDPDGSSALKSRLFLSSLPLADLAPGLVGAWLRPLLGKAGGFDLDASGQIDIDPLGKLLGFETQVRATRLVEGVRVTGRVEGSQLQLTMRFAEQTVRSQCYLPRDSLLGDELSPLTNLPGLKVGQQWTVPVCSPFLPSASPMEMLQAKVELREWLDWQGEAVETLVVCYRADSGAPLLSGRDVRGKLWVRRDGMVLEQEVNVANSKLRFSRLTARQAAPVAAAFGEKWTAQLSSSQGRELLQAVLRSVRPDNDR